ncbi:MAG: phosphatidylserine decarboxylase family protein [Planctomycetes bacterium]|nr:phosphatidylserine decarboxylase family protein [Planctomycetota bacterium]
MARLPLTHYGTVQIVLYGALPLAAGLFLLARAAWWAGLPLCALALFVLWFFRDPERSIPADAGLLVSPADGVVQNVLDVEEPLYLAGRGTRVGVFLSVLDVHVNRAPAAGVVEMVRYTPGRFRDARDARSSAENECNAVGIRLDDGQRILFRQVAGLIARRLVLAVREGDRVERGQRIGMMKFGSYAEVIVPAGSGFHPAASLKEKVKAGETVLFRAAAGR